MFDDTFKIYIETNYCHNLYDEFTKIKSHLLYGIEYYKLQGYSFCDINPISIKTINDKSNITYKQYINQPMSMCKRMINMKIAKNPQLIFSFDRNKNHSLTRKFSHIPFKI